MITIRTSFRISLGGGGTDLPSYYEQYEGHVITAAINKYMYLSINESATSDKLKLYYSTVEILNASDISLIQHNIIRESLLYFNINKPLEIASMADIEAGTGMGSSSSFTVALIAGLNLLDRRVETLQSLAEDACHIEINRVGKKIGKQDQYIAAFGGIQEMHIFKNGRVEIKPLNLKKDFISELERRIVVFYTDKRRESSVVLDSQSDSIKANDKKIIDSMHKIKEKSYLIRDSLINEDIDMLGFLFNEHWIEKKKISGAMTSDNINNWYSLGIKSGALGGKLIGAGGGGFILFVCKDGKRKELIRAMQDEGLRFMDFRFDFDGVKIMANI